ncbi:bifunctional methylenetetrahydrofolate dehydrogenase/methenyltetrahydrofolate cyclohydrolase FolD [Comamonas thiooxydans]|uniref:bifunctional methylenetetrahydrofolate dehydrogenase/methenyltetrahydrofolate cyclohydrolase FolD n=1 Tax=Comamonas thiooxydans TaxID=363952 RepID=UPI002449E4D1|nr:bifunctional methylenetetrahydrofolate dehydrogenase/methenyltetrahydrofolate cyclohydrolase FolD [Comamonas thiooxydans]MDH1255895.1 bifunctional methylenetetrahydrofolate dehydrogenase/methenyltetrahydrofolate cyclohydrolase FolD [Comamonas thiooxydans]
MAAKKIDGKNVAAELRTKVAAAVQQWTGRHGQAPGLAVVLIGNDPASEVYVRNKVRQSEECGIASYEYKRDASCSEQELLALIASLNANDAVHGILVQLPLPKHINTAVILESILPEKDVDGFHPVNVGRLSSGMEGLVPCTPYGAMALIQSVHPKLDGLNAVVVGRSNIVGKPMAQLLLARNCTVTIAHSRTRDLAAVVRQADILVAAVGQSEFIRGDWIKPGACVIDVGINRVSAADGSTRLLGDVAFDEASCVAGAITPVPGGVGPMTIACLLRNTLVAATQSRGETLPAI